MKKYLGILLSSFFIGIYNPLIIQATQETEINIDIADMLVEENLPMIDLEGLNKSIYKLEIPFRDLAIIGSSPDEFIIDFLSDFTVKIYNESEDSVLFYEIRELLRSKYLTDDEIDSVLNYLSDTSRENIPFLNNTYLSGGSFTHVKLLIVFFIVSLISFISLIYRITRKAKLVRITESTSHNLIQNMKPQTLKNKIKPKNEEDYYNPFSTDRDEEPDEPDNENLQEEETINKEIGYDTYENL